VEEALKRGFVFLVVHGAVYAGPGPRTRKIKYPPKQLAPGQAFKIQLKDKGLVPIQDMFDSQVDPLVTVPDTSHKIDYLFLYACYSGVLEGANIQSGGVEIRPGYGMHNRTVGSGDIGLKLMHYDLEGLFDDALEDYRVSRWYRVGTQPLIK